MSKKLTTEEFIAKAILVQGNKYDYSKVDYKGANIKVTIICPIHGDFEQTPNNHFNSKGCRKCVGNICSDNDTFIHKAKLVHGELYDYSKVNYVNNISKVVIICSVHGSFWQAPVSHLQGQRCPGCADKTKTQEQFINEAKSIHNNKYDYSKVSYVNNNTKIMIMCQEHGEFKQIPYAHLNGSGCPTCARYGFDKSKPAYLYYLKITTDNGQILYKIGITNRTVNERFNLTELSKIEIVKQINYSIGQYAYDEEQRILKQFKEFKYTGPAILETGNTELFTVDVFD